MIDSAWWKSTFTVPLKIDQVVHPLNIAQQSEIKPAARDHWEAVNRTEGVGCGAGLLLGYTKGCLALGFTLIFPWGCLRHDSPVGTTETSL